MPTPAYTQFDRASPVVSQTRQVAVDKMRTNLIAMCDAIVNGVATGWARSVSGGTAEEPAQIIFANGVERFRLSMTYAGGFVTNIVRAWSNDSGATYSTIATESITYDGSGNQTTGTNNSLLSWLFEWVGKVKSLRASLNAHAASSGVHGMGSMATQNSTAVDIDGGTVDGAVIGGASSALATFLAAREKHVSIAFAATTTVPWNDRASTDFTATGSGAATLAFSNLPASGTVQTLMVWITNGGLRSWTYPAGTTWAAGSAPTLLSSGLNVLMFTTRDGGASYLGMQVK